MEVLHDRQPLPKRVGRLGLPRFVLDRERFVDESQFPIERRQTVARVVVQRLLARRVLGDELTDMLEAGNGLQCAPVSENPRAASA